MAVFLVPVDCRKVC